jgi:creatinine amidohydrolase
MIGDVSVFGKGQRKEGQLTVFWHEMWRHELLDALKHDPVVIIPSGSVEQHGPHCPMDVDISHTQALAVETARAINDFPVIVAPPLWIGLTHYNMGEVGTITLSVETYIAYVSDVCRSIHANGFKRIILLNGHGGNRSINQVISTKLAEKDVWVLAITYWDMSQKILDEEAETDFGFIGHGGEWETSLQLYLRPDLIDESRKVADAERPGLKPETLKFTSFPERRKERERGVHGNPMTASADKGKVLFDHSKSRLVEVCKELHALPVRGYREFGSHSS